MDKNISYVTVYDPSDIHKWSGCSYFIAKSLTEQGNNLEYIGNLKYKTNRILKLKRRYYKIHGREFILNREPSVVEHFTKQIVKQISPRSNVIFSPGSVPISLLETNKPKVFYTDATFAGMVDFYDNFSSLSSETIRHGHYLEKRSLESAAMAIYTSEWAAQSAIEFYNIDPRKVKVVPFGANLSEEKSFKDLEPILRSKEKRELHLLFIGVEWKRKGGDMAVSVAKNLNERGIQTTLHVVGLDTIPIEPLPDFVLHHGFISKSTREGTEQLNSLYNKCHFLLVPSKAEAFGIVFAEANSFGVPAISTNVGGIPSAIRDDINGKKFSLTDCADVYADYIQEIFLDQKRYKELCHSSFNEYAQRLNWKVSGKLLSDHINSL